MTKQSASARILKNVLEIAVRALREASPPATAKIADAQAAAAAALLSTIDFTRDLCLSRASHSLSMALVQTEQAIERVSSFYDAEAIAPIEEELHKARGLLKGVRTALDDAQVYTRKIEEYADSVEEFLRKWVEEDARLRNASGEGEKKGT